jgi:hypothetical protein
MDEEQSKMLTIVERIESGEDVSDDDIQKLQAWYNMSVTALQNDIEITKLKKQLEI